MDTAGIPTSGEGKAGGAEPLNEEELEGLRAASLSWAQSDDPPERAAGVMNLRLLDTIAACQAEAGVLREALAKSGAILEALQMSVKWELAPSVKQEIAEAIPLVRVALFSIPASQVYAERVERLEAVVESARKLPMPSIPTMNVAGEYWTQTEQDWRNFRDALAALDGGAVPTGEK